MKGKWARGIPPRFFAWIIKGHLAVSERPGGYARNHRKVRRREEILWLRGEGFTRVVSLLPSPHNLHAYDELGVTWSHLPFGPHDDPALVLADLYPRLKEWLSEGERLLVHQEELGDRLMGVVGGLSALVRPGAQRSAGHRRDREDPGATDGARRARAGGAGPHAQRSRRRDPGALIPYVSDGLE